MVDTLEPITVTGGIGAVPVNLRHMESHCNGVKHQHEHEVLCEPSCNISDLIIADRTRVFSVVIITPWGIMGGPQGISSPREHYIPWHYPRGFEGPHTCSLMQRTHANGLPGGNSPIGTSGHSRGANSSHSGKHCPKTCITTPNM